MNYLVKQRMLGLKISCNAHDIMSSVVFDYHVKRIRFAKEQSL